jgi:hypothetical protein
MPGCIVSFFIQMDRDDNYGRIGRILAWMVM